MTADHRTFAVIIPTLQRSTQLVELLDRLLKSPYVSEVVVINNAAHPLDVTFPDAEQTKLVVLDQPQNIFVNPAWNLGVANSTAPLIVLCNDDVLFDVEALLPAVRRRLNRFTGIIGPAVHCFDSTEVGRPRFRPAYRRGWGFGTVLFMRRESYRSIPEHLRILCGDDFLFDSQRGWNLVFDRVRLESEIGVTSGSPEFQLILAQDHDSYAAAPQRTFRRTHLIDGLLHRSLRWARQRLRR